MVKCSNCGKDIPKGQEVHARGKDFHSKCLRSSVRRAADTHIKEEAAHKRKEEDIPDFELTQEARRASRTSLRFAKEGPTIMGDGKGRPDDEDGEDKKEKPKMKPGPVKVGTSKSSGKGKKADPTHCFFCSRSVKDETNPKVVKGQAICMSCRMEGKKLA